MAGRGRLDVPVVGVARSGWTREQLVERARASVTEYGGLDRGELRHARRAAALRRRRLQRPGDLRRACAPSSRGARRPVALPRDSAEPLPGRGREPRRPPAAPTDARVIVEKPFGRDLASARELNRDRCTRPSPRRASSASTTTSARRRCRTSSTSASPTPSSSRSGTATTSRTCRSPWPRRSASRGAASSTRRPASSAT